MITREAIRWKLCLSRLIGHQKKFKAFWKNTIISSWKSWLAHEIVYPGTFVPLVSTRKSGSLMTKLFPNMALTLGWPLYLKRILLLLDMAIMT